MNIVFMGTPSYATEILKSLMQHHQVSAVFTQPDRPVGRKKVLTPPDVKAYILEAELAIDIYQPEKLRDDENIEILKSLNPDFIIVAAYGQILPRSILDIAPCINLHASLLPLHRGASPIQAQILAKNKFVGVSAMLMEEGLDTGDILAMRVFNQSDENVDVLFQKLSIDAAALTLKTLEDFDALVPLKQNDAKSTYAKKIKREHGEITCDDAKILMQAYRAYHGWPEIFLENGLKFKHITLNESENEHKAQEILKIEKDHIVIGCLKGSINVYTVQAKSKKEMDSVSYIRGKRLEVGDTLS